MTSRVRVVGFDLIRVWARSMITRSRKEKMAV